MLARWIRADGQFVPPGRFMPFAETSGHIFAITRQLMAKTAKDLGAFYGANPQLKVSINLFAGHFEDRQIIEDIIATFGDSPIRYDQLVFEVTERYPLKDLNVARKIIAEIRALGCRVALDDTGTGHGGLAYIQQLGIDIIKIDKMFVDVLNKDQVSSSIVDVLAELARTLDMGIIAEGVEHEDQIDRLVKIGVTSAQGYLFSPALSGRHYLQLAAELTKPLGAQTEKAA
jgi:sensor c-di-GMP phosphodiesterase-like protein